MAMYAGLRPQDENSNVHYGGVPVGFKTDGSTTQKRGGGLAVRKALGDISNSRQPSALQASKKRNTMNVIHFSEDLGVSRTGESNAKGPRKAQASTVRKALSDVTNKGKPLDQAVLKKKSLHDKKLVTVAEDNIPDDILEEGFLHNHDECIEAEKKAFDMSRKAVLGLDDVSDISVQVLSPGFLMSGKTKGVNPEVIFEMEEEELPELIFEDRSRKFLKTKFPLSPVFGSPSESPELPSLDFEPEFILPDSPKR